MKKQIKEIFESPKAEIVIFAAEDVIITSGGFTPGENEGPFVPADQ